MSVETILILFYGTPLLVVLCYLSVLLVQQNRSLEALLLIRERELRREEEAERMRRREQP